MNVDHRASGPLPHLGLLRFAGPDAASFLQGQVSNDTRRLTAGTALLAAYSTPQGRVVALLRLLAHPTGLMAVLPREIVLPTLERLRKFVMRAKVQIEDVSDQFAVAGVYGADVRRLSGAPNVGTAAVGTAPVSTAPVGAGPERCWAIGGLADLEALGVAGDGVDTARVEHDWRLDDIRAGLPQVYAATREMFVAQMLNLDLIDGISFTKGCFTGQEIVARTQHLGRIKRRLFRLRLPQGTWAIGQAVHLRDGRSGRLTEVADTVDGIEALAVLAVDAGAQSEAEPTTGPVVDAIELPLPYPLTQQA